MANRSLLQKKMKIARRHKFGRFSSARVKTRSNGPGSGEIINYQILPPAHPFKDGTSGDPYWDVIFPPHIYSDEQLQLREATVDGWRKAEAYPLAEVKRRLAREVNTPLHLHVKIFDAPLRKVNMHFNSEKNYVYFCDYNYRRGLFRKSLPYSDVFHAKDMFKRGLVQWHDSILIEFVIP